MAGSTFNVMAVLTGKVAGLDQFDVFNRRLNTVGKTADSVNRQMASLAGGVRALAAGLGLAQLASFGAEMARVTIQLDAYQAQLKQGFGGYAGQQLKEIRDVLRELGIAQDEALGSSVRFTTSMRISGLSAKDATQTFRDAATWILANKLNGEEANRVFNAMSQTFSKGRLTAEELRGQMGDAGLAGAFELVAKNLGMTGLQLDEAMKKGAVSAMDFRRALSGIAADIDVNALESASRSLGNLKNAWFDLKAAFFSADVVKKSLDLVASGLKWVAESADGLKQTAINALQVASAFALWRGASTFVWALAFSLRTYGVAATFAINVTRPLQAAFVALTATMAVNPFVAAGTAVVALVAALYTLKDMITPVSGEAATLGDYMSVMAGDVMVLTSVLWEMAGKAFAAVRDGLAKIGELLPAIDWETAGKVAKSFGNSVIGTFMAILTANYRIGSLIYSAWSRTFSAIKDLGYNFTLDIMAMFSGDFSFKNLRAGLGKELNLLANDARAVGKGVSDALTYDYLGAAGAYVQDVRRRANARRAAGPAATPPPGGTLAPPPAANDNAGDKEKKKARDAFAEMMADLQFEREQLKRNAREQFIMTQLRQADVAPMSEQAKMLRERAGLLFDEREKQEEVNRALERAATLREMLTKAMKDGAKVRDDIDRLRGRSQAEIDRRNYEESLAADVEQQAAQYARQKDAAGKPLYDRQQLAQFRSELDATAKQAMDIYDRSQSDLFAAQANWVNGLQSGMQAYLESIRNTAGDVQQAVSNAFKGAEDALVQFAMTGKLSFKDMANSIIADLIRIAIRQSVVSAITKGLGSIFGGVGPNPALAGDAAATIAANPSLFANGGAFDFGGVRKFAQGGIVSSPTFFRYGGGVGQMGEAGPEGIVPLKRMNNGRLGVETSGVGGGNQSVVVNVNVEAGTQQSQGDPGKAAELGKLVANVVRAELVQQKRPGGLLAA